MLLYFIFLPIVWLVWHIMWRIRVEGREYLEPYKNGDRGFVIAANHISDLDPVYIVLARFSFHRMNILAKAELFRVWIVGFVLGSFGAVPIERGKGDTDTLDGIVQDCKNGTGLLIFAEGTRTKTGKIGPLKSGAFLIAGQAGVDMIPCRIIYGTESGFMRLFCRVRVCFGEPIPAGQLKINDPKHSIRELRGLKHLLLDRWQALFDANRFTEYPIPGSSLPDQKPARPARPAAAGAGIGNGRPAAAEKAGPVQDAAAPATVPETDAAEPEAAAVIPGAAAQADPARRPQ